MGRIEHYRNVCRDLETRLMKESEKFDEAVARKSALQDEINEIEVRSAEEESRVLPDAQMEYEAPDTGAGVGDFVSPSILRRR